VIFAGKLLYEQWQGPLPFESVDMVTVASVAPSAGRRWACVAAAADTDARIFFVMQ
jgi:hypothetical protein